MRKIIFFLVLIPILIIAGIFIYLQSGKVITIPLKTVTLEHKFNIEDFKNKVSIPLVPTLKIFYREKYAHFNLELFNENLAAELNKSTKPSQGCYARITPSGSGEIRLCSFTGLSINHVKATPKKEAQIWIRGKLDFQQTYLGKTKEKEKLAIEFIPSITNGVLSLRTKSFNLDGSPGEIDKKVVGKIGTISAPLHSCLIDRTIHLENLNYQKNGKEIELEVKASPENLFHIGVCFLKQSSIFQK